MMAISFGFSAGEIDPALWGRSDIERYALGAAKLQNFFVGYGGMAYFRPGTEFGALCQFPNEPHRLFPFILGADRANAYAVLVGPTYIRFLRGGEYLLETEVGYSEINFGVVNSTAHGFSNGDLVYVADTPVPYVVSSATTNTYILRTVFSGPVFLNEGSGVARRVVTLSHNYVPSDLPKLRATQSLTEMRFTHPSYPPYVLRVSSGNFTFTQEVRDGGKPISSTLSETTSGRFVRFVRVTAPGSGYSNAAELDVTDPTGTGAVIEPIITDGAITSVVVVEGGSGYTSPSITVTDPDGSDAEFNVELSTAEAEFVWTVSAVVDGVETGVARPRVVTGAPNISAAAGWYRLSWTAVSGATDYNVYRSRIYPAAGGANAGVELGFIGTTKALSLTDGNIQPDFTRQPKPYFDPFRPGGIEYVEILTSSSGFAQNATVSVTDSTGSGFEGWPVVDDGKVVAIIVADGGQNYTAPTLTVTGGTVTTEIDLRPSLGIYPQVSFNFQQRAGYAGSILSPMTLWAAALNDSTRYGIPSIPSAEDPYVFELDNPSVTPIQAAMSVQNGLMLFTNQQVAMLQGEDNIAVTSVNAVVVPQSYVGSADVLPVTVGDDILYIAEKRAGVRLLQFSREIRRWVSREISTLSRHLFADRDVVALAPTTSSDYRGYAVCSDGQAVSFTVHPNENVFAFTPMGTQGDFLDAVTVDVGDEEHVYFLVKRGVYLGVEVLTPKSPEFIEDAIHLDGALSTGRVYPEASLSVEIVDEETVWVESPIAVFSVGDIGKVIGVNGGRGFIDNYSNNLRVRLKLTRPLESTRRALPGRWWIAEYVTKVSGIPYEGMTVSVVGDGRRLDDVVVVDGEITLSKPSAVVHVGFFYEGVLETLPFPDTDGIDALPIQVSLTYRRIGGPTVNGSPVALRTDEPWIEPNNAKRGEHWMWVKASLAENKRVRIEVDDALPCELLKVVTAYQPQRVLWAGDSPSGPGNASAGEQRE